MGVFKHINKNLKIKTQFVLFFISTTIVSIILSLIVLTLFLSTCYNKKVACSNEVYASRNVDKIFNENFKNEIDREVLKKDFDYWIVLKNKDVLYSSTDSKLPGEISIKSNRYFTKEYDKKDKKMYVVVFTPLISNNKLKGGFVQKYKSNSIAETAVIDKLMRKVGSDLFYPLFAIISVLLIHFIVVICFSWLFSSGINKNLKKLIKISDKIKNGRLDFKIDLSYKNEIGEVLKAFEEMRSTLEKSLKTQWLMTQQRKDMILALTHDIKTPITIIYGHLELLSGNYGNISEKQKEDYIKILLNNADKVRRLINQLNEVWDLERPNLSLNVQAVNMDEFISCIKENIYCLCNEKKVNFVVSHSFKDTESCYFDAFRIEETLSNIISNSLKYTKENDEILLESFLKDNSLFFRVSDTGKGFTNETNIIFNKYYKENEDVAYKNSSGLGLYICKLIVEKHNGKIHAYNNTKGGATVEFSLPRRNAHIL
ncbi:ATP-binding protein (plasmid) [Haloimpatiens sp. FM7330]|uniref:HAMP domain-containing sensor histidine kinase n=1 Tax=Haloimpatiens sp. FM7330 TaxID=3298610 RepID=UPI003640B77C